MKRNKSSNVDGLELLNLGFRAVAQNRSKPLETIYCEIGKIFGITGEAERDRFKQSSHTSFSLRDIILLILYCLLGSPLFKPIMGGRCFLFLWI